MARKTLYMPKVYHKQSRLNLKKSDFNQTNAVLIKLPASGNLVMDDQTTASFSKFYSCIVTQSSIAMGG